jgi:hypothetical protein
MRSLGERPVVAHAGQHISLATCGKEADRCRPMRSRPISGQSVHFHRGLLVLALESVVVVTARETMPDALPVL